MYKKELTLVILVSLFALFSLLFIFYSDSSITGKITGFAAKSFLDASNEAMQGLVKTSKDVIVDNPLRISKNIEDIFELQVSEGKELPSLEKASILISPAEWCSRNWREREDCVKTGGNTTGRVSTISGKPEYFCSCDCATLLGGKNESLINNRKCVCKNSNLEILGTPPRCQTKCSNSGGRHENNDPTKSCICPSGTVYIQNAGCTKTVFQNQTISSVKNISATVTPSSSSTQTQSPSPSPIINKSPTPQQTISPTPKPTTYSSQPNTALSPTPYTLPPVSYSPQPTPYFVPTPYRSQPVLVSPITYMPIATPPKKVEEYTSYPEQTIQPKTVEIKTQPIQFTKQIKISEEECKQILNNFAKQQYDYFLKSWPQINLMSQQPNFKGMYESLRNRLEQVLEKSIKNEAIQNKCEENIAEHIADSWLINFDNTFKKFALQDKEEFEKQSENSQTSHKIASNIAQKESYSKPSKESKIRK